MTLAPGTKLGIYEILSAIGAGGMGEVYRAHDSTLRRDVAIKLIPATFARDEERLRRFSLEAQATAALNHPNILSIFQVGEHRDAPYLVTELLEGQTLREELRQGPLPVRKAVDLGIQIARGLAAAHGKGIIHRDLKPENIFVTKDGRAKILDFGLAKLVEVVDTNPANSPTLTAGTGVGTIVGTAAYMSPEQVRGQAVDARSDIFSFGLVLYEMLSGKGPFTRDTSAETLVAILKEDAPAFDAARDMPPGLNRIVEHCLEKKPEERFQSASDIGFDLGMMSSQSTGAIKTVQADNVAIRWWRYAGIAAAVLAVGGLAGLFLRPAKSGITPEWKRITFSKGMIANARFAPDGQTVIYSAAWNGKPFELYSTRPGSPESRALGLQKSTLDAVSSLGELAITKVAQAVGPGIFAGTLARMPMESALPRDVVEDCVFADWSPDGKNLLIAILDSNGSRIEYPQGNKVLQTSGYVAWPRISANGEWIGYLDYSEPGTNSGKIMLSDLQGHTKTLSDGWSDITGLTWSPKGDELWFTGSRTSSQIALFGVALDGRERKILTIPGDLQILDKTADGRVLISTLLWRAEIYGKSSAEKEEREVSLHDFPMPSDLSADGKAVLFHQEGEGGGPNSRSYLGGLDGSEALILGEGICSGLSPDGAWVVCRSANEPAPLTLVPIKSGTSRKLPNDGLNHLDAYWARDGKELVVVGVEGNGAPKIYVVNIETGARRTLGAEGVLPYSVKQSPDGRSVAASTDRVVICQLDTGACRGIEGTMGELAAGWTEDGKSIYIAKPWMVPMSVYVVEVATGKRRLWKELAPPDLAGVNFIIPVIVRQDGRSYVYGLNRRLCDLYVVTGLK